MDILFFKQLRVHHAEIPATTLQWLMMLYREDENYLYIYIIVLNQ